MNSEDPSHDKHALVVPFHDADRVRRLHKSPPRLSPKSQPCDHELLDVLSSPLREDKMISDDEWRQRSVDNIMALLKANADLRALAVKLSDILAARGGWDRDDLEKATKVAHPRAPKDAQKPRRSGGNNP
jgi:hypothetical protein